MAGWGLCYAQPHILPKASPLDSKERSALRFSRFQEKTRPRRPKENGTEAIYGRYGYIFSRVTGLFESASEVRN